MESLLGGCMAGTMFHLFAGQPLTIIGSTGPILVFEKIMHELCGFVHSVSKNLVLVSIKL